MSSTCPVFYTFLRIDYSEVPSFRDLIDSIHKQFINLGYIEKKEETITEIEYNLETNEKNVKKISSSHFINIQKDKGINIAKDYIVIHTTGYQGYDVFLSQCSDIFLILSDNFKDTLIKGVNFRYLNSFIKDSFSKLKHAQLMLDDIDDIDDTKIYKTRHLMLEKIQEKELNKFLFSRLVLSDTNESKPIMPQELLGFINQLKLNERFDNLRGKRVTLDIDCKYPQLRMSLKDIDLKEIVTEMHQDIKFIFGNMINNE